MTTPCGYQQIAAGGADSAVGLTVPTANSIQGSNQLPTQCIITPVTQAIRWRDDGVTQIGTGMLASQTSAQGGGGISTTANPTLTRDYLTQETEYTLTATKATAGDTFQLENLLVTLS